MVFCTQLADAVEAPKLAFSLLALGLSFAVAGLPRFPWRPLAICLGGWWSVATLAWWLGGLSGGTMQWVETCVVLGFAWLWLSGRAGRPADWTYGVACGWWVTAAYSWIQRLGLDPIDWSRPDLSRERTIAGLGNPNYLGFYLAILAPVIWLMCQRSGWRRSVAILAWTLGILALVMTGTRGSWLALAVAGAVMGLGALRWHPQLRRPLLATLALLLVLVPLVSRLRISATEEMTVGSRFQELLSSQNVSSQTRLMLWRAALLEIREKPVLGWGQGWFSYRALYHRDTEPMPLRQLQRRPENSHNHYLDVAFNSGLLGLAFYCAAGIVAFRQAWGRSAEDPRGLALLAGLAAYAVNALFIGPTLTSSLVVLWMAAAAESPPPTPLPEGMSLDRWIGGLLGVGLGLGAAAIVACEMFLWRGDDHVVPYTERHLVAPEAVVAQAVQDYRRAALCAPAWRAKVAEQKLLLVQPHISVPGLASLCQRYPEDGFLWAILAGESERQMAQGGVNPQLITRAWREAVARDPYNPIFRIHFSRWLWRTEDYTGALAEVDRALEIFPEDNDALFHRALTLHSLGKEREAEAAWQFLCSRDQSFAPKKPW